MSDTTALARVTSDARAFLRGAAHALDLGAALLAEEPWEGPEADARALGNDWRTALAQVRWEFDVQEQGEEE